MVSGRPEWGSPRPLPTPWRRVNPVELPEPMKLKLDNVAVYWYWRMPQPPMTPGTALAAGLKSTPTPCRSRTVMGPPRPHYSTLDNVPGERISTCRAGHGNWSSKGCKRAWSLCVIVGKEAEANRRLPSLNAVVGRKPLPSVFVTFH